MFIVDVKPEWLRNMGSSATEMVSLCGTCGLQPYKIKKDGTLARLNDDIEALKQTNIVFARKLGNCVGDG
jgi:hypothetical protein